MILSIIICSLTSRIQLWTELIKHLNFQLNKLDKESIIISERDVQVLNLIDNKEWTTGRKRQQGLNMAKGQYVVFIDDDDWVFDYYLEEMIKACKSDCDCIGINGIMTTNGSDEIAWRLSKDYQNETIIENGRPIYLRRTNHITAVKREIALAAGFNDISNGEDKYYSERLNLKTEYKIDKPMYHYRFSTLNKEY